MATETSGETNPLDELIDRADKYSKDLTLVNKKTMDELREDLRIIRDDIESMGDSEEGTSHGSSHNPGEGGIAIILRKVSKK